jgi:hypothetical protein
MKKIRLIIMVLGILAVSTPVMQGCKGTQGDPGPAGVAGPAGTQGVAGAAGSAGAAGATGTANVIYSAWETLTFTGSGTSWTATQNAPRITQDILDKGVVLGYLKSGTNYFDIPLISGTTSFLKYQQVGKIIYLSTVTGSSFTFRYVIIPGGVGARLASVDYGNYESVKQAYNLPD